MDQQEFNKKAKEIFENKVKPQIKKAKMKQTAVEYLVNKLPQRIKNQFQYEIEEALDMEKDQVDIQKIIGSVLGLLAGIAIGWMMFS